MFVELVRNVELLHTQYPVHVLMDIQEIHSYNVLKMSEMIQFNLVSLTHVHLMQFVWRKTEQALVNVSRITLEIHMKDAVQNVY